MTVDSITDPVVERRHKERQARIALIQQAAIQVFAELGYEKATMAMVAQRAALGKASLYYYFRTKQELFGRIVGEAAEDLSRGLRRMLAGTEEPLEGVERVCRFALDYFRSNRDLVALVHPLIAGGFERLVDLVGETIAAEVARAHAPIFHAVEPLALGLPEGSAVSDLLASVLLGMATKVLQRADQRLDREIDLFVTLLAHNARRTAPE